MAWEVEAELLYGGEPGLLDALDHAALSVDQFQLREPGEIADMVDAIAGAVPRLLIVLAQEGRQLQTLR